MLTNKPQEINNTRHGLERMLNMLIKLMLLMKLQRLFNTYKLVLLLLNLRVDLKRSKLSCWKASMLSLSHLLVP